MSAQDYGNIGDYAVNGDNYTRIQPSGTLTIPGAYGQKPLIATPTEATFQSVQGCGAGNIAALIAHEVRTKFYYVVKIAQFDPSAYVPCATGQIELCALAGILSCYAPDGSPADCTTPLQFAVDALTGQPLTNFFPVWLLNLLGIAPGLPYGPGEPPTATFDFWFVGCYSAPFTLTLNPMPGPMTCPPPSLPVSVNGVIVCMTDPPIPNHLPRSFRSKPAQPSAPAAGAASVPAVASGMTPTVPQLPQQATPRTPLNGSLASTLNVALRTPVPFVPGRGCGCDDESEEEELIADLQKVKSDIRGLLS